MLYLPENKQIRISEWFPEPLGVDTQRDDPRWLILWKIDEEDSKTPCEAAQGHLARHLRSHDDHPRRRQHLRVRRDRPGHRRTGLRRSLGCQRDVKRNRVTPAQKATRSRSHRPDANHPKIRGSESQHTKFRFSPQRVYKTNLEKRRYPPYLPMSTPSRLE